MTWSTSSFGKYRKRTERRETRGKKHKDIDAVIKARWPWRWAGNCQVLGRQRQSNLASAWMWGVWKKGEITVGKNRIGNSHIYLQLFKSLCLTSGTLHIYLSAIVFFFNFSWLVDNKLPQTEWLKQKFIFSQFWRLEVPDQGTSWLSSWSTRFLACRWLLSHWAFTWWREFVLSSFSYKATVLLN